MPDLLFGVTSSSPMSSALHSHSQFGEMGAATADELFVQAQALGAALMPAAEHDELMQELEQLRGANAAGMTQVETMQQGHAQEVQHRNRLCMLSCSHALMLSCSHALMLSCSHALMLSCSHALMLSCSHVLMLSSHALMLSCSHALMLSCSHALMFSCFNCCS
jgi:hypothetical protein